MDDSTPDYCQTALMYDWSGVWVATTPSDWSRTTPSDWSDVTPWLQTTPSDWFRTLPTDWCDITPSDGSRVVWPEPTTQSAVPSRRSPVPSGSSISGRRVRLQWKKSVPAVQQCSCSQTSPPQSPSCLVPRVPLNYSQTGSSDLQPADLYLKEYILGTGRNGQSAPAVSCLAAQPDVAGLTSQRPSQPSVALQTTDCGSCRDQGTGSSCLRPDSCRDQGTGSSSLRHGRLSDDSDIGEKKRDC